MNTAKRSVSAKSCIHTPIGSSIAVVCASAPLFANTEYCRCGFATGLVPKANISPLSESIFGCGASAWRSRRPKLYAPSVSSVSGSI